MMKVSAVSFGNNYTPQSPDRKNTAAESVAIGAGTTGYVATASKAARKGEGVKNFLASARKGTEQLTKSEKFINKIFGNFRKNVQTFSKDIAARLAKLQNVKIIGPIITSPAIKAFSGALGGILAFFVLITGISKAFKTGEMAAMDFANN